MTDHVQTPSAEEIAQHYAAAMDSVDLINSEKPEIMSNEDWADTLERNAAHLEIMVEKDYWTTENLTPFTTAIAKARA
jgi:hypothetical protein